MQYRASSPGHDHIGATAQAIPRPEPNRTAAASIPAVPCHRDETPARDIAAALATRFRVPVAASCGLHVDNAPDDDIERLLDIVHELIGRMRMRPGSSSVRSQAVAVSGACSGVIPTGRAIGSVDPAGQADAVV